MTPWRIAQLTLGCLNIAVIIVFGYAVYRGGVPFAREGQPPTIEYKDFVTIILTAVTVMLAAVTIFLAVAAIWGYNTLKEAAQREAAKMARTNKALNEQIDDNADDIGAAAGSDSR